MGRELAHVLDGPITEVTRLQRGAGFAVVVTRGDDVLYLRAFGFADAREQRELTIDSLFSVASITKLFTATAVMQLVERGLVELDAPVKRYLPYFRLADQRDSSITIAHLLTHTSGLPDHDVYTYHLDPQHDDSALERYVRSLVSVSLAHDPGSRYQYANRGFVVLGDVVAKVSRKPFETFVQCSILEPFGMRDSTLFPVEAPIDRLARPHVLDEGGRTVPSDVFAYNRATAPDGALLTSPLDLSRFARFVASSGEIGGEAVLTRATLESMWRRRADTSDRATPQMGLGFKLRTQHGRLVVGHGGFDLGYRVALSVVPSERIAVAVLMNSMWGPTLETVVAVLDVVTEGAPMPPLVPPPETWRRLAGVYRSASADEARIAYEHGDLCVMHGATRVRLTPLNRETFVAQAAAGPPPVLWILRAGETPELRRGSESFARLT